MPDDVTARGDPFDSLGVIRPEPPPPAEAPGAGPDGAARGSRVRYPVNDVYACVQGEGCLTGTAMVLIRLHGCGVGCPWCDARETWARREADRVGTLDEALGTNPRWYEATAAELAGYARARFPGPRWALLTGGEPADHDLAPLAARLRMAGFRVAVETSGTAVGHVGAMLDWVCVSPKAKMPGGLALRVEAFGEADEIKHVVCGPADVERLGQLLATVGSVLKKTVQVCLQPVSTSEKATLLCVESVIERGWRLSLQTHKLIGQR